MLLRIVILTITGWRFWEMTEPTGEASRKMEINVVNKHHMLTGETGEYVGRGSPLGNPWTISPSRPREMVLEFYRAYLMRSLEVEDPDIMREMIRLLNIARERPLTLVCFCKPAACHADIIREALLSCDDPSS
jgi:hypothetical protein